MTDDWASYFTHTNEELASVFVNLGLCTEAPIDSKPWRLWVRIYFRNPRPDGLSRSDEAPTLFLIEDALNLQITRECDAITPGRITVGGRREFCYYAKTNENFRTAVTTALAVFPEYRFELAEKLDAEWEYYLNVLYPPREDLERIKNRQLLDVLAKQGDAPTIAREVQHWVFFPSEESRMQFRHEACNLGFGIGYEYECESDVQGDCRFAVTVLRSQPIEQKLIDDTVIELFRLAKRFGGEYDGWETQVTTQ